MLKNSSLFTISGPSGVGKTSLVKTLAQADKNLKVSISYTTRPPRCDEIDGKNYHFIDETTFDDMFKQGGFIESAEVFGHLYGTSRAWVDNQMEAGFDVALEIDWQGAALIKKRMPSTCSIFLLPPSKIALQDRLTARGQDDPEVIERRMSKAVEEISHFQSSDYLILNDNFEAALQKLLAIVSCRRLLTTQRPAILEKILSDLLQ